VTDCGINDLVRKAVYTDTPDGFELFYSLIWDNSLPPHAKDWIIRSYNNRGEGLGSLIYACVGFTKSVTMMTLMAYQIGLHPERRNMLVGASDEKASDNIKKLADIIENNPVWKALFPHVVPDKNAGWSLAGFHVKRTDVDYGEFRRRIGIDPCFLGLGITSHAIPGKHPDGVYLFDDLNTEDTARSDKERSYINDLLSKTILSRVLPDQTWLIGIGTPWARDDAMAQMEATKMFDVMRTPIIDEAGAPVWPEHRGPKQIEYLKNLLGPVGFATMCMLDLSAAEGKVLKKEWLHQYPVERINPTWPIVMGVDYASENDPMASRQDRDNFAIAVGCEMPGGGIILIDGFYGRLSTTECEMKILQFANKYPGYKRIRTESLGKGEEFYWNINRKHGLRLYRGTVDNKSKAFRFTKILATLFDTNRAWVTQAANDFVKRFEKEWVEWEDKSHKADDCLDAVYHMIKASTNIPKAAFDVDGSEALPEPKPISENFWAKIGAEL
jgi:hypothetical protein